MRLPLFSVSAIEPVHVTVYEIRRVWRAACRLPLGSSDLAGARTGRSTTGVPVSMNRCDCLEEELVPHAVAKSSFTVSLPPSMSV